MKIGQYTARIPHHSFLRGHTSWMVRIGDITEISWYFLLLPKGDDLITDDGT